jgi:hypothetical protein
MRAEAGAGESGKKIGAPLDAADDGDGGPVGGAFRR